MKNRPFSLFNITCLSSLIIVLLGLSSAASWGESYRVEKWSVAGEPTYGVGQYVSAKGLPQISIKSIVKDNNGFVWLGTENGLARFDGRKFEFFNTINTPELGSNWINALFLDNTGRLWIVTGVGLVSFDDGKFEAFSANFDDKPIKQVIADDKNTVWVITDSLWSLQGDRAKPYSYADTTFTNSYYDTRNLWLLTSQGELLQTSLTSSVQERCRYPIGVFANAERLLVQKDTVYILQKQKLHRFTLSSESCLFKTMPAFAEIKFKSLFSTQNGGVVAVSDKGQLLDISSEAEPTFNSLTPFVENNLLLDNSVLLNDEETWFLGTKANGLVIYWKTNVRRVAPTQNISSARIWSFFAREDRLYTATNKGVFQSNSEDDWTLIVPPSAIEGNDAYSIFEGNGEFWVGTRRGLFRSKNGASQFEAIPEFTGLQINTLYQGDDAFYVATTKGLFQFDGVDFKSVPLFEKQSVRSILTAKDGVLWVGTESGLFSQTDGKWRKVELLNGTSVFASSLLELNDGRLFVGTYGQGLLMLDESKQWRSFNIKNGLPFQNFFSVTTRGSKLWLSGASGVAYVEIDDITDSHVKSTVVLRDDGTFSARADLRCCNGAGNLRSIVFKDTLYLPTLNGVVAVQKSENHELAARTIITGVYVDGKRENNYSNRINLNTKRNAEIIFSRPIFSAESVPEYRYRLDDSDWIYSGSREEAFLAKLSAGETVFEVQSRIDGEGWLPGDAIVLYVKPHWWESNWAKLVGVLALLAVFYIIYRLRIASYRQRNEILEARVNERTAAFERVNSELQQKNKALEEAAITDPLTGLYNRRAVKNFAPKIFDAVNAKTEQQDASDGVDEVCAIFLIDLDNFKQLNDTYGHDKGDSALHHVGQALRTVSRNTDRLIRWGGEEFLLVVPSINPNDIDEFNKRLHKSIAPLHHVLELPEPISMSIGATKLPWDDCLLDSRVWEHAILIADWALYQAKNNGRNTTVFINASKEMAAWTDWSVNGLSNAANKGLLLSTSLENRSDT
ncbi:ligand-binding sensor domain-containing diguanylate cyclase [Alteromonas macleodii]|uniref:ligand-binding sensor domain-containing diguanylate cyclase n=1 Tax=Alteromonas macleodii TaxID=28108 RepID=UPI002FE2D758